MDGISLIGYNVIMNIINLPIVSNKRECGTCTKCCEGWLMGNVRGHEMYTGKPCFFVEQGVGCKDYDNRPKYPCVSFNCGWKEIVEMPEEFKPENSGVILQLSKEKNIEFIAIIKAPLDPSIEMLSWMIKYIKSNQLNLLWAIKNERYWLGNDEFCKLMEGYSRRG